MARHSLTLYDYSDRELLLRILDEGDERGWVNTHDLARALGIDAERPGQHVGIRLSWMRRYGAVERKPDEPEWRLTPTGRALALGELSPEQAAVLGELSPEQMLNLTRLLTTRYRRVGDTAAHLMRREWQVGLYSRRHRGR